MQDYIPNNIFISGELERQINTIVSFKHQLKSKYPSEFSADTEDAFIHLDFDSMPKSEGGRERLLFQSSYDEKTPSYIKKEFETFLEGFRI